MHRFDQKAPENVAELEELRSWDHELHLVAIYQNISTPREKKTCLLQATSRSMALHYITLLTADIC